MEAQREGSGLLTHRLVPVESFHDDDDAVLALQKPDDEKQDAEEQQEQPDQDQHEHDWEVVGTVLASIISVHVGVAVAARCSRTGVDAGGKLRVARVPPDQAVTRVDRAAAGCALVPSFTRALEGIGAHRWAAAALRTVPARNAGALVDVDLAVQASEARDAVAGVVVDRDGGVSCGLAAGRPVLCTRENVHKHAHEFRI